MSKRKLIVKTSSLDESLARFKDSWKKAETGEKVDLPIEVLSFENTILLMKTLTPKRLELLQSLHKLGMVSIRQLAKKLHRDYSNVYADVKALTQIGIIENKDAKYFVPWDTIITEIPLCIEKTPGNHDHQHYDSLAACGGHK